MTLWTNSQSGFIINTAEVWITLWEDAHILGQTPHTHTHLYIRPGGTELIKEDKNEEILSVMLSDILRFLSGFCHNNCYSSLQTKIKNFFLNSC